MQPRQRQSAVWVPPTERTLLAVTLAFLGACAGTAPVAMPEAVTPADPVEEEVIPEPIAPPTGQLPTTVEPTRYAIALQVDPREDRFQGEVHIQLRTTEPLRQIWLHGNGLEVSEVSVTPAQGTPIGAAYAQHDDEGLAELQLESTLPAGEAVLRVRYAAPYNRALRGLYRVDEEGESYAFTQFEATSARLAFPSFDEPRFKTPFEMTLTVRDADVALFNTPEVDRQSAGNGMTRVRFAPTRRLPTYLLAMAVGPLEVVDHEPIPANEVRSSPLPFRGVATKGKGERLAYALERTGAIVAALEQYFGMPYPYEKLDVVAVPDFAAGAMENAGLITFRDPLLLLDDTAPERQQRAFAYVMAHELAHQWFGNLVTLAWWDDIWLNEAFATWMGYKITDEVFPEQQADLAFLERVHGAMHSDSLVSARQIRQPIESNHDIRNAFDSITYRKGGGVLAMFERFLTPEIFQQGVRAYMREHADGIATYRELLGALDAASGRDVTSSFSTFLFQPGLPLLNVSISCEGDAPTARIRQQRYLPVGSEGSTDRTWSLPVCVRYGTDEGVQTACNLIQEAEGAVPLAACPQWLMPNADGAGYYRFAMEGADLRALAERGFGSLTDREKLAYRDALDGAFGAGALAVDDALAAYEALASEELRTLRTAALSFFEFAAHHLVPEKKAQVWRRAARIYGRMARRLGFVARANEDGETALLRSRVVGAALTRFEDARLRREAKTRILRYLGMGRRGDGEIHTDALSADLVGAALVVAVQEGDEAFVEALVARFRASSDAVLRAQILGALARSRDPEVRTMARNLALDSDVRVNEMLIPFYVQMAFPETQGEAWAFLQAQHEALTGRLESSSARLLGLSGGFCSTERAAELEAFYGPRAEEIAGGPRALAGTLERVRLCAARVATHREGAQEVF